jgi:hypothetical protein
MCVKHRNAPDIVIDKSIQISNYFGRALRSRIEGLDQFMRK